MLAAGCKSEMLEFWEGWVLTLLNLPAEHCSEDTHVPQAVNGM